MTDAIARRSPLAFGARLRLPRRTVRLRLTLLYGALFLASGIGLLVLTNVLVRHATGNFVLIHGTGDGAAAGLAVAAQVTDLSAELARRGLIDPAAAQQLEAQGQASRALAVQQRDAEMRQLLLQSGVALSVMAVVSIGLGWLVAGRVLRPLRTITSTVRDISATNLHQRLALGGPDDELKELGDTFDELLGRLQRVFDAQRQFVANASHELRTPLARQRTLIEVALGDPDATVDSLRATHQRVLASGEQQERLIEALLLLARSERRSDRHEPLDLAMLAGDVLLAVQPELDRRGLLMQRKLGGAPMVGDLPLIERLVTNLVENAMRYNIADGRIEIATGMSGGRAFLVVSNTGPAIPPAEVDGLFQPFRRLGADRVRRTGGQGLGLSIVQAIATAHAATLHAAARAEGGLDVEVRFPPPAAHADNQTHVSRHGSFPTARGGAAGMAGRA